LLKPVAGVLQTGDPAATIDRLFISQHVTDLQLIIAFAFLLVLFIMVVVALVSLGNQVQGQWSTINLHAWFAAAGSFFTFFTPVFAIFGAVLAWAYQIGSARLGVVDLFACEISTLCRVAAVMDTVRRFVDRFEEGPPAESVGGPVVPVHQFTSQENYFPVFEDNTRDLQTLEARVVINITAFYTYMKAVRDSIRTLADIRPQAADLVSPSEGPATGSWHEAVRNVIYMFFLALESARLAIADLVEFEPERAERTIVILISELEAYRFLCKQYPDEQEMHHERIMLRSPEYRALVPSLCEAVEAGRALEKTNESRMASSEPQEVSQWEQAWRLLPELRRRYHAAIASINT
jgi:hypothetical protein